MYARNSPLILTDPQGTLPANVTMEGLNCIPTGFASPGGSIDASNPCPIGFIPGGNPGTSTKSRTQQVRDMFEPFVGFIVDWDYANDSGTAFEIMFPAYMQDILTSTNFLPGVPIIVSVGPEVITVIIRGAVATAFFLYQIYQADIGRVEYDRKRCEALTWPGDDPNGSPGPDWKKNEHGTWERIDPTTGNPETLRPDLNHKPPMEPHWDYWGPGGSVWRKFKDGRCELKSRG